MRPEDLIAKQEEEGCDTQAGTLRSVGGLGRTVARMHQQVTILFTDIVGFTAMSQTCQPYEVMNFLHNLFVEFDALVDRESQVGQATTHTHVHIYKTHAHTHTIRHSHNRSD